MNMNGYFESKKFFELLMKHTDMKIDLSMIHTDTLKDRKSSKKFTFARNIAICDAMKCLEKENAWWKNQKRNENFYFAFSKEQKYNIAFVDDIRRIDAFVQKDHFLLVQTSQKKYQAYFLLDRGVSYEELLNIQRVLVRFYQGDIAAVSPVQPKRVCGFLNTKYPEAPLVRVIHVGKSILSADQVLSYSVKKKEEDGKIEFDFTDGTIEEKQARKKRKSWSDFYDGQDESRADMSYALYLLGLGYDDSEIRNILLSESKDIIKRKGKHYVEQYIERTIEKAKIFFRR